MLSKKFLAVLVFLALNFSLVSFSADLPDYNVNFERIVVTFSDDGKNCNSVIVEEKEIFNEREIEFAYSSFLGAPKIESSKWFGIIKRGFIDGQEVIAHESDNRVYLFNTAPFETGEIAKKIPIKPGSHSIMFEFESSNDICPMLLNFSLSPLEKIYSFSLNVNAIGEGTIRQMTGKLEDGTDFFEVINNDKIFNGLIERSETKNFAFLYGSELMKKPFGFEEEKSYYYPRYETTLNVNPDSSIDAVEKQTINFRGNFSYAYRYFNEDWWSIENIQVFENGEKLPVEIKEEINSKNVKWYFNANNEERTFELHYKIYDLIDFSRQKDVLFWTGIAKDHKVKVETAVVKIIFPKELALSEVKLETIPKTALKKKIEKNSFYFEAKNFEAYQVFDIKVSFPKGIIKMSFLFFFKQILVIIAIALAFLVPISAFLRGYNYWKKFGCDPNIAGEQKAQLAKLRPAIVGVLLKEKADFEEVTATILDLAQRGYIFISENSKHLFFTDFEFLKTKNDFSQLLDYEKDLMKTIFQGGEKTSLSELRERTTVCYSIVGNIKMIEEEAGKQKLFEENPENVIKKYAARASFYTTLLLVVGFSFYFLGFSLLVSASGFFLLWLIGIGIFFIKKIFSMKNYTEKDKQIKGIFLKDDVFFIILWSIVLLGAWAKLFNPVLGGVLIVFSAGTAIIINSSFAKAMPKRTVLGVLNRQKYEELKQWMEKHPLKEERMFNEFLPYSIIFGIHKKWLNKYKKAFGEKEVKMSYGNFSSIDSVIVFSHAFATASLGTRSASTGFGSGFSGFGGGFGGGGGGGGGGFGAG